MKARRIHVMHLPTEEFHDIRFLPNHRNPNESITSIETYTDPDGDPCTRDEYLKWKQLGETSVHYTVRHYCNAIVNGEPVHLIFGLAMKRLIDGFSKGKLVYSIDGKEVLSVTSNSIGPDSDKYILDEPVNIFDLHHDISVKISIEYVLGGYKTMKVHKIVRDPKNILWYENPDETIVSNIMRKKEVMNFFDEWYGDSLA